MVTGAWLSIAWHCGYNGLYMATGRNELCPCGSGKKYKHCHEGKRHVSKGMIALLVAAAVIATVGVVASVMDRNDPPQATTGANPNPMSPGAKQPPGPAPAGKVWSEEHGHWHDVNVAPTQQPGAAQPITVGNTGKAPVPQPPGTPPPGKVWSPEHGHWHDAPK
jgi:hypothetical protein